MGNIYYVDPEGGSNLNTGLSFAQRIQDISTKYFQYADEIRIMASRDPVNMGNTTFTNGTDTVTIPVAKNVTIFDCDTAWTASANVTCTTSTASFVEGTASSVITASAFTTGKLAYVTLASPLNLSGYEAFSFMVTSTAALQGNWSLRLCSDTTGNTIVATVNLSADAGWRNIYYDGSTPLGTIQSISLFTTSDPGTVPLYIDNIVACRHKDHADHISHTSLVGKNTVAEPEWYPIMGILGGQLRFRATTNPKSSASLIAKFRGVTETVPAYVFLPTPVSNANGEWGYLFTYYGGGKYTAGWNRTDMSTQTGQTWLSGQRVSYYAMSIGNNIEGGRLGFCHHLNGISAGSADIAGMVDIQGVNTQYQRSIYSRSSYSVATFKAGQINCYGLPIVALGQITRINRLLNSVPVPGMTSAAILANNNPKARISIKFFAGAPVGVLFDTAGQTATITDAQIVDVTAPYVFTTAGHSLGNGGVSAATADTMSMFNINTCEMHFINCTGHGASYAARGNVYVEDFTTGVQKISQYTNNRVVGFFGQDTDTNAGTGFSWKYVGAGAVSSYFPQQAIIGCIAVNAGVQVTVKAWVKVGAATTHAGIGTDETDGEPGVATSVVYGSSSTTYEQLTFTFTPTVRGVVPIYGYVYTDAGVSAPTAWFDDLTYTQGAAIVYAAPAYLSRGVRFTSGLNLSTSALTTTDSPFVAWSFWAKWPNSTDLTNSVIFASSPSNYVNYSYPLFPSGQVAGQVGVIGGANAGKYYEKSETVAPSLNQWHHYLFVFRSDGTGNTMRIYRDRVEVGTNLIHNEATPLTPTYNGLPFYVGSDSFGSNYNVEIGEFWFSTGHDLLETNGYVSSATLDKFVTSDLWPVDLGADGSTPTGSVPAIYLRRGPSAAETAFVTNLGNGGTFSLTAGDQSSLGDGTIIGPSHTDYADANVGSGKVVNYGTSLRGVLFDSGTILKTTSLTVTNSPYFAVSFWARWTTRVDLHNSVMFVSDPQTNYLSWAAPQGGGANDGHMRFTIGDIPNSLFRAMTSGEVEPLNTWNHYFMVFRRQTGINANVSHIYRNRVLTGTNNSNSSDSEFSPTLNGYSFYVGSDGGNSNKGQFEMAEFYLSVGHDFIESDGSVSAATLNKFIDPTTLKPVSLGADGSIPSGTAPAVYLHRAAGASPASFVNNLGTGGTFTVDKTLGDGTPL